MEGTREWLSPRDTIAYVIDENSPNTPSDALIVTSYGGGDAEEAWLREHSPACGTMRRAVSSRTLCYRV